MKKSFKDALKETVEFMTLRSKLENNCALGYELNKRTELTDEQKGKYGILGTEKFEKEIDEDER
jgi:hypothetical protein